MSIATLPAIAIAVWSPGMGTAIGTASAAGNDASATAEPSDVAARCEALAHVANLTILEARLRPLAGGARQQCYVRGLVGPAIHYHVQLPLPGAWNGRFVQIGDGGKDGDLDTADPRVEQGYAVANSNAGHDSGAEPGASFAFDNRQAEIDFAYRAVHVTAAAAKTVIAAYYGSSARYAYYEACSAGGRQALVEAQRFPQDFDGIVAGAPVNHYQATNATHAWMLQRLFAGRFAHNLAFDTNGDGVPDSLTKLDLLARAVMDKCDGADGIVDRVIDNPLACPFQPAVDLASRMCPGDVNADACFTRGQIETTRRVYDGARDSHGVRVFKGQAVGSERGWATELIPHAGNRLRPNRLNTAGDHMNFLFYDRDPGVPPSSVTDPTYRPNKHVTPPEFAWWEFDIDDFTSGKADVMRALTDATDPDLSRFLKQRRGKLLLYHGWADATAHPEPTLDYFNAVVERTFAGDVQAARNDVRLFMAPGMGHCDGGRGPNEWDRLRPLVAWVEQQVAPDFIVATHETNGVVDNERKICAAPQAAVYAGPVGGAQDSRNWRADNFTCR